MNRGRGNGKDPMKPRWAIDMPEAATSKPKGAIGKKQRKNPKKAEKPENIEAMLRDPDRRKHVGPCCVSFDGTIRGTKKWGDGKGGEYTDGTRFWECMGCRKLLEKPPPGATADDLEADEAESAKIAAIEAASKAARST